jgi:hypothetical protein
MSTKKRKLFQYKNPTLSLKTLFLAGDNIEKLVSSRALYKMMLKDQLI